MKLRYGWLVVIWSVVVFLCVLALLKLTPNLALWAEALLFLIPAVLASITSYSTYSIFKTKNPEKKTWKLIFIGALSLVIAEIFRGLIHLIPALSDNTIIGYVPYIFILICFIYLIWGFWNQQTTIETTVGKNIQILLLIIIGVFAVVLYFAIVSPVLVSEKNTAFKVFMLIFVIGDLLMFSGALAISFRMWGGRLAKPWLVWSIGTLFIIGFHMYSSYVLIYQKSILASYTGIVLAVGLAIMATACEMRRSLLE